MANNALLALAALILVSIFGVGVFVGVQVVGGGDLGAPGSATPTSSTTPAAGADTPAPTPAPTATPEPTPEPPDPVPADEFNESNVSAYVVEYLNENRTEQGLDPVGTEGRTANMVEAMAQNHSDRMAQAGQLAHTINNVTSEDRYDAYEITSRCSFDGTETPSDNELEAIARTVAGQPYTEDGQRRFNGNESAVAQALVDEMLADDDYRERLLQPTPQLVGVGVNVTDAGDVYATVNTCA